MRIALVLGICLAVVTAAQAGFIIEPRSGGQNYALFSQSGFANSSGNVNAPAAVGPAPASVALAASTYNIGSMYSGCTLYYGPTRQAVYSFTPTTTGLYEIDMAWTSTAGQMDTAVVVYTGAGSGGELDPWGNAGPSGVVQRTTMDMLYKNTSSGEG